MGTNPSFHTHTGLQKPETRSHSRIATSIELSFHCLFFHPKKGLLKRPAVNTNAQFGLATLWRRARHRFTPQIVKDILASPLIDSKTASSCGTSSMILDPIQKLVSRRPNFFDPTKVASLSATPCVVTAPTSKNPIGLSLCEPSTTLSHGGRESQPQKLPNF